MLLLRRHSLRLSGAIGSRVRGSKIRASSGIVEHGLSPPHHCGITFSQNLLMALLPQLILHFW